ncbi:hypothetical protein D9M69_706650 [compost metagenome]
MQLLQLRLAAYESGQPASRSDLQSCAQQAEAEYFIDGKRLGNAFDLSRAQGFELEISLG